MPHQRAVIAAISPLRCNHLAPTGTTILLSVYPLFTQALFQPAKRAAFLHGIGCYTSEAVRLLKNGELRALGEYRTHWLLLVAWDRLEANK